MVGGLHHMSYIPLVLRLLITGGNLLQGGFDSSDRAVFIVTRSGPGSAHAVLTGCGKRPFGAPLDGELGVITRAMWLAPADFQGFPPPVQSRRNYNSLTVRTSLRPASN
jgi:hypothetical protein